jgi:uncharacterized protein YaiE (UPF0345 family)
VLPADYTFTGAGVGRDNGTHAFNGVILVTVGVQTIAATDTVDATITGRTPINVLPAPTDHLRVTPIMAIVGSGVPFTVTVTAQDRFNNTTPAYTGTVHFTTTDPAAAGVVVPGDYRFTSGAGAGMDNGVHTFPAGFTLITAGARMITGTDTVIAAITGRATVTVGTPVVTNFLVTPSVATVTAGVAFTVMVTARDAMNNVVPGYTGTVHFTTNDLAAAGVVVPADYPFTGAGAGNDNGVHNFPAGFTLVTAGARTITATDTVNAAVTGQGQITVNPDAAFTLVVTPAAALVLQGVPTAVTVTARDRFGNIATGYLGTVKFTSNDLMATLPPNTMFTAADRGVHTFISLAGTMYATFKTLGARTITATDTANAAITGTGNVTVVAPAAVAGLQLVVFARRPSTLGPAVLTGQAFTFSVTAVDANGFVTPAYVGTVRFTTTDTAAGVMVPGNYTFLAGDLGTHKFAATLITVPRTLDARKELRVTDTNNGALTGFQLVTVVNQ